MNCGLIIYLLTLLISVHYILYLIDIVVFLFILYYRGLYHIVIKSKRLRTTTPCHMQYSTPLSSTMTSMCNVYFNNKCVFFSQLTPGSVQSPSLYVYGGMNA